MIRITTIDWFGSSLTIISTKAFLISSSPSFAPPPSPLPLPFTAAVIRERGLMASVLFAEVQFLPLPSFAGRPSARPPSLLLLRHRQDRFGLLGGHPSPSLLRGSFVARVGPATYLPDFEAAEGLARELFGRVEGLVYTVADAAVASSDAAAESSKQSGDWLSGITYYLETVLKVESALAMRSLQPQVKAIQQRYAGDQLVPTHGTLVCTSVSKTTKEKKKAYWRRKKEKRKREEGRRGSDGGRERRRMKRKQCRRKKNEEEEVVEEEKKEEVRRRGGESVSGR
ncbi:hypothetical protein BHM03_00048573 [Ensete ventricosum]|nr:hypothetical protein BHM03_00048573 [Ensete ventricosum]